MLWQHILVFFLAGFAQFNLVVNREIPGLAGLIWLSAPILSIYFLGWWALLTCLAGMVFAGYGIATTRNRN